MEQEKWSIDGPRTLDIDDVVELSAEIVRGRLDVITHDEPVTRIEISEVSGGPVEISFSHGRLKISHRVEGSWAPKLESGRLRAVISIAVPAGLAVSAATVSGDGMVCGTTGTTELKTISGSLMADDTEGVLHMDTISGEIIARHHTGPLTAASISGQITASGFLEHIRATTTSGDLSFDLLGSARDIVSTSVSGNVTVRIPYGSGVKLSAKTTPGKIVLADQKFTAKTQTVRTTAGPQDSPLDIHAKSVSGNVSVIQHTRPVPPSQTTTTEA